MSDFGKIITARQKAADEHVRQLQELEDERLGKEYRAKRKAANFVRDVILPELEDARAAYAVAGIAAEIESSGDLGMSVTLAVLKDSARYTLTFTSGMAAHQSGPAPVVFVDGDSVPADASVILKKELVTSHIKKFISRFP